MYAVYILVDPLDSLVRYVGIAEDVYARFIQHISCQDTNFSKNKWVLDLRNKNLMIIMKTVDQAETREEALNLEQKWIHHYSNVGMPLFNRTHVSRPNRKNRQDAGVSLETKRLIQRLIETTALSWSAIAEKVGMTSEKYSLFKAVVAEMGYNTAIRRTHKNVGGNY